jgi:hypothetical protein
LRSCGERRSCATDLQMREYIEQTPAAFGYIDLARGPLHVVT